MKLEDEMYYDVVQERNDNVRPDFCSDGSFEKDRERKSLISFINYMYTEKNLPSQI